MASVESSWVQNIHKSRLRTWTPASCDLCATVQDQMQYSNQYSEYKYSVPVTLNSEIQKHVPRAYLFQKEYSLRTQL